MSTCNNIWCTLYMYTHACTCSSLIYAQYSIDKLVTLKANKYMCLWTYSVIFYPSFLLLIQLWGWAVGTVRVPYKTEGPIPTAMGPALSRANCHGQLQLWSSEPARVLVRCLHHQKGCFDFKIYKSISSYPSPCRLNLQEESSTANLY